MLSCGSILFHKDFVFDDGTSKDKYIIVLGGDAESLVVAKTTSKGKRYRTDHGCQSGSPEPAFYLPQGSSCLPEPTWICLGRLQPVPRRKAAAQLRTRRMRKIGHLSPEQARDVQFCALGSVNYPGLKAGA